MKRIAIVRFSLLLLCVSAPLVAQEWTKTFEVNGPLTLHVTGDDAEVRIRSCECKQVRARVTWQGYKAERVKITPEQSGDHISLDVRTHMAHLNFGISFGPMARWLTIEMTVPKELALEVETKDGRVDASDLKGRLRFKTGDGGIELSGIDGTLEARSGDGHVRVSGRFDDLHVQTSDGPVQIEAIKGSVVNGAWGIQTGDGSVRLRLSRDIHATFSAKTGDGEIHSDFPITVTGDLAKRHHLEGEINGGGGMVTIRTGDGSVFVEKL